jgi:hypothetical protein
MYTKDDVRDTYVVLVAVTLWRSARFTGLNCGLFVAAKAPWAQVRER